MNNRITYCIVLFFILITFVANAQQPSLYSQYMFNGLVINPAYAGSQDALSTTAMIRRQWNRVDGAPTTATFSAHAPVKNEKMALGILMSNDHISVFNQTSLSAVYAYRISISETQKLSFGLQAGFNNYSARYSQLTSKTPNDPSIPGADFSSFSPSFGAGAYYYTDKLYVGLSSPFLTGNIFNSKNNIVLKNYYFLTAGYVFKISSDFKLKPSTLIKYISGSTLQADVNATLLFRDVLWAGVSYRSSNMLIFLTQINITDQFRFGYSYDMSLGKLTGFNSGAHELMLNYLFSFKKTKVVSPRYF